MSDGKSSTPDRHVYRIEAVDGGYEAQMLYQCGAAPREEWFPLNGCGYWSDPDGFAFGLISKRDVFASQAEAAAAIRNAKAINGESWTNQRGVVSYDY
jgi:hypothetical protein